MSCCSLTQTIEPQEIASNFLNALLDFRFSSCPFCCTQFTKGGNGFSHANEASDTVKLVSWNVKLVGSGVVKQEIFTFDTCQIHAGQPFEASNTMFLVDNIVTGFDLCEE